MVVVPIVPPPRRSLDRIRGWYENELGWATVPGEPVRLSVGERFDVLDVPAEAGHAALRHLPPGAPVAVRGDRMRFLVAAGSAEELPGILRWLEWETLPLDLTAIGAGGVIEAPLPPGPTGAPLPSDPTGALLPPVLTGSLLPSGVSRAPVPPFPAGAPEPPAPAGAPTPPVLAGELSSPRLTRGPLPPGLAAAPLPPDDLDGDVDAPCRSPHVEPSAPPGRRRPATAQGAAAWLRPPVAGCEVEVSLPTVSALGGGGGAPDLVRLVNTLATHCHRVRLQRACAQPLAFS